MSSQDRESGAAAVIYGLETAKRIANILGAIKIGNLRSNEYSIDSRKVVIKCARIKTNSVGVSYHMLENLDAIIAAFEINTNTYILYEMEARVFRKNMIPTKSKGPSAGKVGVVKKSIFLDEKNSKRIKTIKL